jgi:hypothetical protein
LVSLAAPPINLVGSVHREEGLAIETDGPRLISGPYGNNRRTEENKIASDTEGGHDFSSLQDTLRRPTAVASIDGTTSNVAVNPAPKGLTSPINSELEPGFNLNTAAEPDDSAFEGADVLSDSK